MKTSSMHQNYLRPLGTDTSSDPMHLTPYLRHCYLDYGPPVLKAHPQKDHFSLALMLPPSWFIYCLFVLRQGLSMSLRLASNSLYSPHWP
jgi:hypothetical protein